MENTRGLISEVRLTAGNASFRFVDLPGMFGRVDVKIMRADASVESYELTAAVETQLEVTLPRCGGVIPLILQKTLAAQGKKEKHER